MERSGSSGNAENGSHLVEVDAAEDHAGQVERSGMSGNSGTGSHLAVTDAAESHARAGCGCGGLTTATQRRHS